MGAYGIWTSDTSEAVLSVNSEYSGWVLYDAQPKPSWPTKVHWTTSKGMCIYNCPCSLWVWLPKAVPLAEVYTAILAALAQRRSSGIDTLPEYDFDKVCAVEDHAFSIRKNSSYITAHVHWFAAQMTWYGVVLTIKMYSVQITSLAAWLSSEHIHHCQVCSSHGTPLQTLPFQVAPSRQILTLVCVYQNTS